MALTIENILLIGSLLLFVSVIAGKTSYQFGVPALLLSLGVGMLAGSDGILGIHFDDPKIAQFIGVVALNFILFSGGLDTSWKSVKPILWQGVVLSTVGVFLTAIILGGFVYYVTDFDIYESMLLGSIVSSTDAAAVFSILRSKNLILGSNLKPTLELESGSNDPTAYVLMFAFLTLIINKDHSFSEVIFVFFKQMVLGGLAGYILARISELIINRIKLDFEGLYPVLVIAIMFFTFSVTDFIGGNGFLAIYLCGIYLGNRELAHKKTILGMYDGLAWLMQIVLFITLGLLVFPVKIQSVLGIGLIISLFLIIVARPVAVFISLIPFKMELKRRLYISWVGLRGAVPIVFATYPLLKGIDKADMIFNIVFFISVTSVIVQGTTIPIVAKWLDVALLVNQKSYLDKDETLTGTPLASLQKIDILPNACAIGKNIKDLSLPQSIFIVMIKRKNSYIRPGGSTVIEAKDRLIISTDNQEDFEKQSERLNQNIKKSLPPSKEINI